MGELRDKLPDERFPASLRPRRAVRPATHFGSASGETDLSLEIVSATANGSLWWPKSPAQAGTIPEMGPVGSSSQPKGGLAIGLARQQLNYPEKWAD